MTEALEEKTIYKVAAIQYAAIHGDKASNLCALSDLATEAAENDAKLIVMPEMATTGYCWNDRDEIAAYVEQIPGPTTQRWECIAEKYQCYICVGLPEVDVATDLYYNSMALIGPEGLIGSYRKTHSNIAEPRWASDGQKGFPIWSTQLGNIGGLICMDLCYFETARITALRGCDIIVFSACWMDIKAPSPLWISAAYENGVYIVAADSWGSERGLQFSGGSCIIDPDGAIQSRIDCGNGVVYGDVDFTRARNKLIKGEVDRLADRRPDQYHRLLQNTYLWPAEQFHGLYGSAPLPQGDKCKIAVVQCAPIPGSLADKALVVESLLADVAKDTKLVVLPELALCSFEDGKPNDSEKEIEETLQEWARVFDLQLVTSLPERVGSGWYHTALLIDEYGIVGRYRKVHLNRFDRRWALPGDSGFPTFDLKLGRVGLLIGCDLFFPEATMSLASWGCDLICVPAALKYPRPIGVDATDIPFPDPIPRSADPLHFLLWRVRAEQTNTYLAISNFSDQDYTGCSGIFSPELEVFPRQERVMAPEQVGVCSLVLHTGIAESAARRKEMLGMRQVHMYEKLVESKERDLDCLEIADHVR